MKSPGGVKMQRKARKLSGKSYRMALGFTICRATYGNGWTNQKIINSAPRQEAAGTVILRNVSGTVSHNCIPTNGISAQVSESYNTNAENINLRIPAYLVT